jgi:hypothetical protein
VTYHLPIDRARDFHTSVLESGSGTGSAPGVIVADVLCLGEKVEEDTSIELLLSQLAAFQEMLAGGIEGAVEGSEEVEGLGSQQRLRFRGDGAEDFNASDWRHCTNHQNPIVPGRGEREREKDGDVREGKGSGTGGTRREIKYFLVTWFGLPWWATDE